jgi:hypothetical protein
LNVLKLTFLSQISPSVHRVSFKYPTTYQKQQRYIFSSLLGMQLVACLGIEGKRKWEAFKLVLREIIKRNATYYIIIPLLLHYIDARLLIYH